MTEGVVTSTFEEDLTYSNAGRLCPNTEAKVFHLETGKELGHNEVFKGGILFYYYPLANAKLIPSSH